MSIILAKNVLRKQRNHPNFNILNLDSYPIDNLFESTDQGYTLFLI